jgi:hypothetical protein
MGTSVSTWEQAAAREVAEEVRRVTKAVAREIAAGRKVKDLKALTFTVDGGGDGISGFDDDVEWASEMRSRVQQVMWSAAGRPWRPDIARHVIDAPFEPSFLEVNGIL